MEIAFIVAVILIIIILIYIVYNLNNKLEIAEEELEIAISQSDDAWTYIQFIKNELSKTYEHMKIIDRNGSFQSDDETGIIFKNILKLLENLDQYINKEIENDAK